MTKFETLCIGKTKSPFLSAGIDEYQKRLSRYTSHTIRIIREKGRYDAEKSMAIEGRQLLDKVSPGSLIAALDFGGRQYSSEQFAGLIDGWERQNIKRVVFIIGGPNGLSPEVKNRADLLLSLSKMTFTHDMARLFLLEQLYRAFTIKAGEKYHK